MGEAKAVPPLVRPLEAHEWRTLRELRLRALADAPEAFSRTLAEEERRSGGEWSRMLAASAGSASQLPLVAEQGGRGVGIAYGQLDAAAPERAHLYSMWVEPAARRSGVGRALVDAIVSWACSKGARTLVLQVTEGNEPALALYRRAGFVPTQELSPLRTGSALQVRTLRRALGPEYTIALARPGDVGALPAIELAAAALLEGHAPPALLRVATGEAVLRAAQAEARLWVALDGDTPVGFALVELLPSGLPHLQEIDVEPRHGRRGIGTALVRAVCEWTLRSGRREITLTTFRDVPWNLPFYARLGFEEIPRAELRPELAVRVREEADRGLDPERRAAMRYRPGGAPWPARGVVE